MKLERYTRIYRTSRCMVLISIFLGFQCFLYGCKPNKDNKSRSADVAGELQLRLETDSPKSEFLLGETVIVRMFLRNTTKNDIVICLWPSRKEQIFTHYEDNKPVVYQDTVVFDRPVSENESFVTIRSGAEIDYGSAEFAEEYESKYFDKIGRWELKFISFYDFTGNRFGIKGWQGKISSNTLFVNIVSQGKLGGI